MERGKESKLKILLGATGKTALGVSAYAASVISAFYVVTGLVSDASAFDKVYNLTEPAILSLFWKGVSVASFYDAYQDIKRAG